MKRMRLIFQGLMPVGLVGAYAGLIIGVLSAKSKGAGNVFGAGMGGFIAGWLYCVAVVCLIRLPRVTPWAYPIVGVFAGPIPFVLLVDKATVVKEPGGWLLTTAVLGLLVGLIECGRLVLLDKSRAQTQSME